MNQNYSYKTSYRSEVDGLRAFAVLSVVAFHAFPYFVVGVFVDKVHFLSYDLMHLVVYLTINLFFKYKLFCILGLFFMIQSYLNFIH